MAVRRVQDTEQRHQITRIQHHPVIIRLKKLQQYESE